MNTNLRVVRVEQVFLKENHNRWIELGKWDSIGMISYSELNQPTPSEPQIKNLDVAKPLWYNFSQIPTINELIYIVEAPSSTYLSNNSTDAYYFPPISIHNTPNHNVLPISLKNKENRLNNEEVEGGGVNKPQEGDYYINLGEKFKEIENIKPLSIDEGDVSIEGRYGNSIKFGSNSEFTNPITILRNGQAQNDIESFKHIKEDINNDNSSIYMYEGDTLKINVASLNDASYLTNIYEIEEEEEPQISNEDMPSNIEDDIVMSTPNNISTLESQDKELENISSKERAYYDIAPTEPIVTIKDGSTQLNFHNNYDLKGININEKLG